MILDELYFRSMENTPLPFEYRETLQEMDAYQEKIKDTLGFPFLDEYTNMNSKLADITARQSYRAGAQFAVRFLLEALL